ncbi:MAG: hypothetical protein PHE55_14530 [Methylococcaceae bacterium]|nr:hypothetical protein [Methylococcaceae bacterium]
MKRKFSPLLDDSFITRYKRSLDDTKQLGRVKGNIDFDRWFDRQYLDKALAEQNRKDFWTEETASPGKL